MAYEAGQRRAVHDLFKDLADDGKKARAIVLSCAGNDVVDVLAALLNHSQAGLGGPINASVVQGVPREQIPAAITPPADVLSVTTTWSELGREASGRVSEPPVVWRRERIGTPIIRPRRPAPEPSAIWERERGARAPARGW